MHIKLIRNDGKEFNQGDELFTNASNFYRSSKPAQTRGRWYFEITHISGFPSVYAGFRHASSGGVFYYKSTSEKIFCPSSSVITCKLKSHSNLDWKTIPSIIGVGIDIDQNRIFFRNDYELLAYEFSVDYGSKLSSWRFSLGEGLNTINDTFSDIVKINFGKHKFNYTVPSGYIPWDSPYRSCPTFQQRFFIKIFTLITIFCISS